MQNERARKHGFRDGNARRWRVEAISLRKPMNRRQVLNTNTENHDFEENQHLKAEQRRARAIGF